MDDSSRIFSNSDRIIGKLQLLAVFFEDELLFKIYVRTQVIHKIFEKNPELNIHKLDLFHIQFTQSIIELLRKIKKNNEKTLLSIQDEIEVNAELIRKLSLTMADEKNFDHEKDVQAAKVGQCIYGMYQNLSDLSKDNPFPKDIGQFGARFGQQYFSEVPDVLMDQLLDYDAEEVYKNGYGVVDKTVLGLECKTDFSNTFICGLRASGIRAEIYQVASEQVFILFCPHRKLLLELDPTQVPGLNEPEPQTQKGKIIEDLVDKNEDLKVRMEVVKRAIPPEVSTLLTEYYGRIEGIDFLDLIDDYDIQANILKTMLNTEGM